MEYYKPIKEKELDFYSGRKKENLSWGMGNSIKPGSFSTM